MKLDKIFFNVCKDCYICFVYASPDKSGKGFGIELYDRIVDSIAENVNKENCLVMGDMNANNKLEPDYVPNDGVHHFENLMCQGTPSGEKQHDIKAC